ncbi:MAG: MFS transporter [Alphaproteobacteria bacterium]|nr:MFS transporter [Alphaproteobacteria bacterium]MCB9797429.1 MFS transporter [Alphaproteobacteria bacterium]
MKESSPAPETTGYVALLTGNVSFRRLYGARLISLFGDWFNTLAVLAALRELGGVDASAFGWVLILKTLPALLAAPLAGVVADRLPRRRILIATDLVRAAIVGGMLALAWLPNVPLLYALVIAQSFASAFFDPARNALLPRVVSREELTAANALGGAAWSMMLAFGAGLGGLVTARWGWGAALAVDAGTYLVSAALLLGVREPPFTPAVSGVPGWRRWTGLDQLREGARYLADRPRVRSLALVKSAFELSGALLLLLTLLGEQVFPVRGEAMLGVAAFYIARGLGTGLGPFLARWWTRSVPEAMERAIGYAFVVASVFYVALSFADQLALALLCVSLAHLGGATQWVFSTIRLQQLVPAELAGRVFAAEQAAYTLTLAGSTFVFGELVDAGVLGVQQATAVIGVLMGVAAAWWAWRGWRLGWAVEDPERG